MSIDPRQRYLDRLAPLVDYVRENPRGDLSVLALARVVHFSPHHFHRIFTAVMGETVGTFVRRVRLERAAQLMKARPGQSLSAIASAAGFASLSDFSRAFRRYYGLAPSRWDRRTHLTLRQDDQAEWPGGTMPDLAGADERGVSSPELREVESQRLAYVRIRRPFEPGALAAGYARLQAWLDRRRIPKGRLLGLSWDDTDLTPPDLITYDLACTVPADVQGGRGIGMRDLPAMLIVAVRATGDLVRVARAWDHLYYDWLPRSAFEPYNLPAFERYRGWPENIESGHWDLDCCIPLKRLDAPRN